MRYYRILNTNYESRDKNAPSCASVHIWQRARILDVFLTNSPLLWKQGTEHPGLVRSDHLVVTALPLVPAKPSRKCNHGKMAIDRKLEESDINFADTLDDPEECVRLFDNKLGAIFDESFPLIKVKKSSRDPPYMTH